VMALELGCVESLAAARGVGRLSHRHCEG
jgi:hypothetical protein